MSDHRQPSLRSNYWCYLFGYTQRLASHWENLSKSYHLLTPRRGKRDTYPAVQEQC